ncbi:MAG TPA: SdrD B-like domain-containing protein [Terriglobales bacterium]|nr:SdrD B-like domain-containing protein [Terriglobales bacterium]
MTIASMLTRFFSVRSTGSDSTRGRNVAERNLRLVLSRRPIPMKSLLVLAPGVLTLLVSFQTMAQIPAKSAFSGTPACSDVDLSQQSPPDIARITPEWKPILLDTRPPNNPPTILEGFVAAPPSNEDSASQAKAEVSEEEVPWNHFTHDFTSKIEPDDAYKYLLSSWKRFPGYSITLGGSDSEAAVACVLQGGTYLGNNQCQLAPPDTDKCPDGSQNDTCVRTDMEVEWENASDMHVNDDNDLKWGALPQFAWPAYGDRVWTEGRWIFDCGHTGVENISHSDRIPNLTDYVKFETEIHPPRALVTFRLNHPAVTDSNSQSNAPASWLPVTGSPVNSYGLTDGPTSVPVTEADIFISGNGGGANDICNLVPDDCSNWGGHSGPWIPVNDRNYVFDIYPPITDYKTLDPTGTGRTFKVTPPVGDASLQWRIVDKSGYIPEHTCGSDPSSCVALPMDQDHVLLCLIDANTPPPDQTETSCPTPVPAQPTRVRVILKFLGSNANYFAQSVLVGWDDVPAPPSTLAVRTFQVSLHKIIVEKNGETFPHNGDWRVFVNVGGQWRYISSMASDANTHDCNHSGTFSDNSLTGNEDEDCYSYDSHPWIVSVQQDTDINVGVGGFESDEIDSDFCPSSPDPFYGCNFDTESYITLFRANDDRIGTLGLKIPSPGYAADQMVAFTSGSSIAPPRFTTTNTGDLCHLSFPLSCDELQYTVEFRVGEVNSVPAPVSGGLQIGDPHYNSYVSSATPFTLSSSDASAQGFQYRFHRQGDVLPTYASNPFPVHWANANFAANTSSINVYLTGTGQGDGTYDLQYSANSFANLLEPRHTVTTILDNTPPVATIGQPTATQYTHADILTLSYLVSDGTGSGVKSSTPKMDGSTSLPDNTPVTGNGQMIPLLIMPLGSHTFSVDSVDNLNNAGTNSVTFTIIVTPDSLITEVNEFLGLGCIDNAGIANSLASKMGAVKNAIANGQIQTAINILSAFIKEVQAQAGKHISTTCTAGGHTYHPVQTLIGDAQYLLGVLGGQLKANPIMGSVVNITLAGISGATVNLLNSTKAVVATATTDVAGFYYFAVTGALNIGKTYTVKVTPPSGYKSSAPSSQSFNWSANTVTLANFGLR